MALSPRQRWTVLGSALALTLGLAAWLGEDAEEPDEPPADRPPAASAEAPAGPAQSGRVGQLAAARPGEAGEITDIFAPQAWQRPAAASPQAEPNAPEVVQLPFTYLGKLVDGSRVTVYLATEKRNLAVRKGDVIDDTWRVESIGPTTMVFRYLPEDRRESLPIGRAK
jgi:hypothetical protein